MVTAALPITWCSRRAPTTKPSLRRRSQFPAGQDEQLVYDFGGGGGWGDALARDPQAVLDDVWDEYVSIEGAARDYGVVITGSLDDMTLAIDHPPPQRRASMRGQIMPHRRTSLLAQPRDPGTTR